MMGNSPFTLRTNIDANTILQFQDNSLYGRIFYNDKGYFSEKRDNNRSVII